MPEIKLFAGRYRVQKSVAAGMSEVFQAYDIDQDRKVALKLLAPGRHDDAIIREIFKRETRALRELKHPHIVEMIDAGFDTASSTAFLVLEWLPVDLAFVVKRRVFDGWDAFYESAGRPILQALAFSHSRQIAHRDVKLSNVLIDEGNTPKLADFGIAKLRADIAPGITLNEFVSRPYAPPEVDEGGYAFSRDVYGFGVLTLRCLVDRELKNYDDVYQSLDDVDVPPEVFEVLDTTLSRNPAERPLNAEVLLDRLERIQAPRQVKWEVRDRVYLSLTRRATDCLREEWPGKSATELEALVLRDLAVCAFEPYKAVPGQFMLLGTEWWYHVAVALPGEESFAVLNAGKDDDVRLEKRRDFAAAAPVEFRFGTPKDSAAARKGILEVAAIVAAHKEDAEARQKQRSEDAILASWERILRAKEDLEKRRSAPIAYDGVEREGNRLRLAPVGVVADAFVGQLRQIRTGDTIHVQGEIEAVQDGALTLYVTADYTGSVPRRGELVMDIAMSRRALERQRAALDAVRFDRARRADLRRLIVDPASCRIPTDVEIPSFHLDIDASKQQAVKAAIGAEDFLLVEGPPGTGKTTFIAELILQTLDRKPDARVLLASQTHVALDNALEGLRKTDPSIRLVRVGRPGDNRISAGVTDLLLETQMPTWRTECLGKADEFLRSYAAERGIAIDHLFVARGLRELARIRARRKEIHDAIADVQQRLAAWREENPASRSSEDEGTVPLEVAELQGTEATLRKELKDLRDWEAQAVTALVKLDPDVAEVVEDPASDLEAWESTYRPATKSSSELDQLIDIRSDWDLRFGRGPEFTSALISSAQVVAGTCIGIASIRGISAIEFDLCVIDEASKATATEALVPISLASRWIMVGDEQQLPPFVEDDLGRPEVQASFDLRPDDLKLTLFTQLSAHLPADCKQSLLVQHRMRRAIGTMVSECFYDGRLRNGEAAAKDALNVFPRPVTWFSTARLGDRNERLSHMSYANPCESRWITGILRKVDAVAASAGQRLRVAILTAYSGQRTDILRRLATGQQPQWLDIECNTVDAFQGREAHVAIYSVTRCNDRGEIGFLRDLRRLNVALSRARYGVAIVGDHVFARNASGENPFRRVVEFIEQHPDAGAIQMVGT